MNTIKTLKGTELPLTNLKGKDYLMVQWRLVWFREEKPEWSIETSLQHGDKHCYARAEIKNEIGRIIATAHKREDQVHFADYSEKAETGAIGRALALCGYGTQFAPDFNEEDRIVDSPVTPKNTRTAKKDFINAESPEDTKDLSHYKINVGKFKGETLGNLPKKDLEGYHKYMTDMLHKSGKPATGGLYDDLAAIKYYLGRL